ncbi:MAG: hypothetical protein ABEJ87_00605 [Candidatus Nanohalobium sp.]
MSTENVTTKTRTERAPLERPEAGEGMTIDITEDPEVPEDLRRIRQEVPEEQFSRPDYGEQSSGDFVKAEMSSPESEGLDGSLTNDLVETQVGTVLKKFSERPSMAYIQMLGRIPSGKLEYQDQEKRIENEEAFRSYAEEMDVEVPEILGVRGQYVEFEQVEGVDMNTYLNQASQDEAYEAGELAGEFLAGIHGQGGAIMDLRINNLMMQEDGGLAFVDGEFFTRDATEWEKKMDMITMASSAKQVEPEAYESFREGFEERYGEGIDAYEDAVSSVTAPGHAALLERDSDRVRNAASNIRGDAVRYVQDFF